ncbi:MAG: hypothetical protein HY808_15235 [Nitrospirae bacterium]|nr:hypothetical protein [Nitrospirota bacterium]
MIQKKPICAARIRKIPKQFSWVDQRLVRSHYIEQCTHRAATLYLFLVTVSDAMGMSYYSDATLENRLSMDTRLLTETREELVKIGLIAYERPLYQVLSLDLPASQTVRPQAIGDIFKQLMKGVA